ncbi:MAG TPA: hypothetical protein VFX11_06550, partial [Candidatus Kapabacteria bacterium]|nr:hypothetical protein [Candidatus Kapabacteria bacterium]
MAPWKFSFFIRSYTETQGCDEKGFNMRKFFFSALMLAVWNFSLPSAFAFNGFDNMCGWIRTAPGKARIVYMRHDGEWRTYRLYVPQSYQPNAPLVVD